MFFQTEQLHSGSSLALLAAASVIYKDPSSTSDEDVLELDSMLRR